MAELHWATLWEHFADAIPDADAVVQGERRLSWGALDERASRLAGAIQAAGVDEGARVAQFLSNGPEYVESFLATMKGRGVAVNVNYRYLEEELLYLLENSDAEVLFFHSSLGERVAKALARATNLKLAVGVDDDGSPLPEGTVAYEELIASSEAAPRIERGEDDRTMLYTGGTTGMPKGVMGRVGPGVLSLITAVPPLLGEAPCTTVDEAVALAKRFAESNRQFVGCSPCPLMHGTGLVIGMQATMSVGGKLVLPANRKFDASELWDVAAREGVNFIAVVGDPFARPMLEALERTPRQDLESVRFISSSGAMFSTEIKEGLIRHLPHLAILDYISSSEGLMGVSIAAAGNIPATGTFSPVPGVKVFDEDDREVEPGSGKAGIVGLSGGVPDGYFKDEAKSARTFREVNGVRYSFPGDWALVEADGSLTLLGRGSQCINTGGEKVFPEEVEEVIKRHPAVRDCLVVGLPDERFGQRIAAAVSVEGPRELTLEDVLSVARSALSSYKLPRELLVLDEVPRTPAGKADYATVKECFERDSA